MGMTGSKAALASKSHSTPCLGTFWRLGQRSNVQNHEVFGASKFFAAQTCKFFLGGPVRLLDNKEIFWSLVRICKRKNKVMFKNFGTVPTH